MSHGSHRIGALLRLAVLPAMLLVGAFVAWQLGYFQLDNRVELFERVQRLRVVPGIEVGFAVTVTLAVMLCLPLSALTLLGGAVFGTFWGAVLTWSGALGGTLFGYLLARTVGRAPVRRLFGSHSLLERLRAHDSVTGLFRLRVLPVAPYGVLVYVAGLGGISLRRLLIASALGTSLNVAAYSYIGSALFRGLASGEDVTHASIAIAVGVTLLMLGLSLVPRLLRRAD